MLKSPGHSLNAKHDGKDLCLLHLKTIIDWSEQSRPVLGKVSIYMFPCGKKCY